ncbi:MAG: LysR family transcriptional regulator [Proteobacteria bacterium]|nr:LysR family transcriptional regulator [Pseudomonadota bacterium]
MDPSIRQLRSFVAIAKAGSFTRAAQMLHVSQPALTVQIRQLEAALKVRLFDRNTRSVHVTRVGSEMVLVFERLLAELDTAVSGANELASIRHGIVRLACLPSLAATILPKAIAAFRVRHPHVEFVLKDGVGGRVIALVKAEAVDFGITAGAVDDPELNASVLMRDRMHAVYLSPHPLDRDARITLDALSRHPLILMDEESTVRQIVEQAFREAGRSKTAAIEATYMSTALGMVRAKLGVALLPSTAIEARASGKIRSRPIAGSNFIRPILVVRKTGRSLPPASSSFVSAFKTLQERG